jgi:hypothetical protein
MTTDKSGWNTTEVIDLPYGADIMRLRRDGTRRHIVNGVETVVMRSKLDLSLLSPADRAIYDAWRADQERYAAL